MIDMNLHSQQFAEDYEKWDSYYNYMLVSFYVTRISKQCARFNEQFPYSLNFQVFGTNKFVLTKESNRATMGRNFDDTYFVQDTYYNVARYIYEHPNEDKQSIKQYLLDEGRCIPKAFAMQYLIGAIEASDQVAFKRCMIKLRTIPWNEAFTLEKNNKLVPRWNVTWDGLDL
jgi:hypothetical protein